MKVKLSNGQYAIIDKDDISKVRGSWYVTDNGYVAQRYWDKDTKTHKHRRMHRVINNTPSGLYTDHINNNKLDNRKSNLRTVTLAENQLNRSMNSNNKLGYPGLFVEPNGKYRARIQIKGKKVNLGNFTIIEDAISALKSKRKELGFSI